MMVFVASCVANVLLMYPRVSFALQHVCILHASAYCSYYKADWFVHNDIEAPI